MVRQGHMRVSHFGSGTDFSVTPASYILTNRHVVTYRAEGKSTLCNLVTVGQVLVLKEAEIIAIDDTNDLALLKVVMDESDALAINGTNAAPLDSIIVAGFPLSGRLSSSVKVTKGVVNSDSGPPLPGSLGDNYSLLQIDAAMQPGNSGGPIINERGNVVGVEVGAYAEKFRRETGVLPQNINFGIKSSIARTFLSTNNIDLPPPNPKPLITLELRERITKSTHRVICSITCAQLRGIKKRRKKELKVSPSVLRQIEALR
jgi:serine protease Do